MTEQKWLKCTDPTPMLAFLRGKASERKARLFGCACCRRIWGFLTNISSREAVEEAERFADGLITRHRLELAAARAETREGGVESYSDSAKLAARLALVELAGTMEAAVFKMGPKAATAILRELFNPFLPTPAIDSTVLAWNDATVRRIAQTIYGDRAFDLMPILADALDEAGCTDADILNHCRQPGEHVRGCWVLDVVLSKE